MISKKKKKSREHGGHINILCIQLGFETNLCSQKYSCGGMATKYHRREKKRAAERRRELQREEHLYAARYSSIAWRPETALEGLLQSSVSCNEEITRE